VTPISTPHSGSIFINDLCRLDCALFDPGLGVYGQSWHVDLIASGELTREGFVHDFGPLKRFVKDTLEQTVDHALLIPISSKFVQYREGSQGESWLLESTAKGQKHIWQYDCPKGAVYPIHTVGLKKNVIEQELERLLRHRLPESVHQVKINLREEVISATEASFRYTHGLQLHNGLCQRLFHGHRSKLEVYVDDERRPDLEHFIVRDVFGRNVHVVSTSQMAKVDAEPGKRLDHIAAVNVIYDSQAGHFEGQIPGNRVFLVEGETSIECITHQLAKLVRAEEAHADSVRVLCYEGIGKGSICQL
jgi:6-pyruvoyl-tetrahydropterin synthase